MTKHILIVGSGSIGQRHARNLAALGCRVACVDPRSDRREALSDETPTTGAYETVETALDADTFDGAVIGSPTAFHVDQGIALLDAGVALLLEKPVAPDWQGAERLRAKARETGVAVLLGYTWRWWPPLGQVRQLLSDGEVGAMRHVRFVMSAHLADWHPYEPYNAWFMASKEQGGGALLDESHWIDLCLWLFGLPERVFARIETISDLEISSDDNVDMVLTYPDNLRVSIHLDLYGRPHEKSIRFSGEGGTVWWTADPNRVAVGKDWSETWDETLYDCERNDMFVAVAKEYLAVLEGSAPATCTLDDGLDVMRVIEAARLSAAEGREVGIGEAIR